MNNRFVADDLECFRFLSHGVSRNWGYKFVKLRDLKGNKRVISALLNVSKGNIRVRENYGDRVEKMKVKE